MGGKDEALVGNVNSLHRKVQKHNAQSQQDHPPPLHCLDNPDDIADAVLFLLSDVPSWIAGQATEAAGGQVL